MIAKVFSNDGTPLYCKVKANAVSFASTQDQLRRVAKDRTTTDLLADDYFRTPEEAASSGAYFGTLEAGPA